MIRTRTQSGFTAVELLITLFVAAAFLIAGYQLFNFVLKDGGNTRAQSRASNVAYDYLRRYSDSATNPCTESTPVTGQSISVEGLSKVTLTVAITCPEPDAPTISKINALISYNTPQQTLQYATFVDKSKGATPNTDVTNGLVGRWLFNGNANADVGGSNGTVYGATPTTNMFSQPNTAYSFDGSVQSQYIGVDSTLGVGPTNTTATFWVYNPSTSGSGQFLKIGHPLGIGLGIGNSIFDNTNPGTKIIGLFEGVRWIPTSTDLGTGWHMLAIVLDSSGTPSIYKDGALVGTYTGSNATFPSDGGSIQIGGRTGRWTTSSMDDVRLYSRALSGSEILQLFNGGAK